MPVPARSFRFELGGTGEIHPTRARTRWLTERVATLGQGLTKIRFKNENAGSDLAGKEN
jgi:hypothetical protein